MTCSAHEGTEAWIRADGAAAVPIRRSLMAWVETVEGGEVEQIAAIIALIDIARHTALSHPKYREGLAQAFYVAADEVAANELSCEEK